MNRGCGWGWWCRHGDWGVWTREGTDRDMAGLCGKGKCVNLRDVDMGVYTLPQDGH